MLIVHGLCTCTHVAYIANNTRQHACTCIYIIMYGSMYYTCTCMYVPSLQKSYSIIEHIFDCHKSLPRTFAAKKDAGKCRITTQGFTAILHVYTCSQGWAPCVLLFYCIYVFISSDGGYFLLLTNTIKDTSPILYGEDTYTVH